MVEEGLSIPRGTYLPDAIKDDLRSQIHKLQTTKTFSQKGFQFEYDDGLLYQITGTRRRLVIPAPQVQDLLHDAHDQRHHIGEARLPFVD